mmetsp:Transcript_15857/g.24675  ORF Transcript_15857/g.24675 Transcript_15857/m.24675 type:complete len:157 (-) Transcript_15857:1284-1754(-)
MSDISPRLEAAQNEKWSVMKWLFGGKKVTSAKGGFAAFSSKSATFEKDIDEFNALILRIKTDGRLYFLNLRTEALGHGDVYQAPIEAPAGHWADVKVPITQFVLTSRGLINLSEARMNWRKVTSVGISIMDGNDGAFEFEIDSIRLSYDENIPHAD